MKNNFLMIRNGLYELADFAFLLNLKCGIAHFGDIHFVKLVRFLLLICLWPVDLPAMNNTGFGSLGSETIYVIKEDNGGRLIIGSDEGLYLYNGYELRSLLNKSEEVLYMDVNPDNIVFPYYYSGGLELVDIGGNDKSLSAWNIQLARYRQEGYHYVPGSTGITNEFMVSKNDTLFLVFNASGEITRKYRYPHLEHYSLQRVINLWGQRQFWVLDENSTAVFIQDCSRNVLRDLGINVGSNFKHIVPVNDSTVAFVKESLQDSLIYLILNEEMEIVKKSSKALEYQVLNLCYANDGIFVTYREGGFQKYNLQLRSSPLYSRESTVNYVHEFRGHYFVGTLDQGIYRIEDVANQIHVRQHFQADQVKCLFPGRNDMAYYGVKDGQLFIASGDTLCWSGNVVSTEGRIENPVSEFFWYDSTLFASGYFLDEHVPDPFAPGAMPSDRDLLLRHIDGVGVYKSKTFFNGDLWICHHTGLTRVSVQEGRMSTSLVLKKRIHHIEFIDTSYALLVLRDGLYLFDLVADTLHKLTAIDRSVSTIRDIYIDRRKGYCYIASNNGLFQYPIRILKERSSLKTVGAGLKQLLEIRTEKLLFRDSFLFAMHNQSITQIDLEKRLFIHYDQERGLPEGPFQDIEVFRGSIYLATMKAVYSFPVQKMHHNPSNKVELVGVQTNKRSLGAHDTYYFQPDETTIQFLLTNSLWKSSDHLYYEFRILPQQDEWTRIEDMKLTFYDLPPKSYRLELRLVNKSWKDSSNQIQRISFEIEPFLWQTFWFQSSSLVLTASSLFLFFFIRNRRIQRAMVNELNHQRIVSDLRFKMIRAQINPHFIFNCLNSVSLLNFRKQHEQVGYYIHLFSNMIKSNLRMADITFHTVKSECEYLENYLALEKLRFKDQLISSVSIDDEVYPERQIPCFFIQIFVENSIKHGRKADAPLRIDIRFRGGESNPLEVIVEDDGKGFSGENEGGLGLRLIRDRIMIYRKSYNYHISLTQANKPNQKGTITHLIFDHEPD